MTKFIKELNYFIYILLIFYLAVDSLTGISIAAGGPSFSIPYKVFILFLMTLVICNYEYTGFKVLVIFFMSALMFISCFVLLIFGITDLSFYVQQYIKLFANIIFFFYFLVLSKTEARFEYYINNIVKFNLIIFLLNIAVGILGYGHSSYDGADVSNGTSGFFYAANETYLILLSLSTILLLNSKRNIFLYCFFLYLAIKIGTKSAILAVFVISIYDFYSKSAKKSKILIWLFIPIFLLGIYLFYIHFLSSLHSFEYVSSELHKSEGNRKLILNAIMSGRIHNLEIAQENWKRILTLPLLLFGTSNSVTSTVEIDFFDVCFINGILLTVIISIFYMYLIIKAKKMGVGLILIMNIIYVLISFLAGHTWRNLSGGIFFIMANVMMIKNINISFAEQHKLKSIISLCLKIR